MGLLLLVEGAGWAHASSVPSAAGPSASLSTASLSDAALHQARLALAPGAGPGAVPAPASSHPAVGPNVSFGIVMTYDAYDGYVVAVALNDSAGPSNNTYGPTELTWKFSAGNWSLLNTTGAVPATLAPGLVYDARDQYVLLYGGRLMDTGSNDAPLTNQTFSYRAGVWTNLSNSSTPAPFAVDFPNLVYDAADEYVLLYDEVGVLSSNGSETIETTWAYASGIWTDLTPTAGTPPAFFGGLAYDVADRYVVYFGGQALSDALTNSTFIFRGGAWANVTTSVRGSPSARMDYGIAYDGAQGRVLLYGGLDQLYVFNGSEFSRETWAYSSGNWSLLSSNGSAYNVQSMVYDASDNETVLLGSSNFTASPPNVVTFTFGSGTWSVAAPVLVASAPVADTGQAFRLDVTASPNAGGLYYRYLGLPSGCASVDAPSISCTTSVAGSYDIEVDVTGAEGFLATPRAIVEINPPPTLLEFGPTTPVGEVGIAIGFTTSAVQGSGDLTYSYAGLPPGCASTNAAELRCIPTLAGTFEVTANVTDGVGVSALGTAQVEVLPALALTAFGTNHGVVDAGQTISVQASLDGGASPYTYGYTGLPAGCGSLNASSFTCQPTGIGEFSIGLHASDVFGAMIGANAALIVNPWPTIEPLVLSQKQIAAGGSTTITTATSGGTAPFVFLYSGLPEGCGEATGTTVVCTSIPTGQYAVTVTVVDATGARASATGSFTVIPSGSKAVGPKLPLSPPSPSPAAVASALGFWWGLAVGAVAIILAGAAGSRRILLARQGREIVGAVRAGEGKLSPDSASAPARDLDDGGPPR